MENNEAFEEWYKMFGHTYAVGLQNKTAMQAAYKAGVKLSEVEIGMLNNKVAVALEMEQRIRVDLNNSRLTVSLLKNCVAELEKKLEGFQTIG